MNIGAIYNLTGDQKNLDIPSSQGALLAVEELNSNGGVLGRKVNLILEDGETNPAAITRKTEAMIDANSDMPVLIGMSDTDVVLAAAHVAAKHKRLFITSGATSPLLPEHVPDYLFLACYGDNVQAAAAAEWAVHNLKISKVAVLYKQGMSYTELLRKYFVSRYTELGGTITFDKAYTADSFAELFGELGDAELIFLSASPDEVISEVSQLRNAGIAVPILSGDGFDIGEGWQQLPDEDNSYFTTHADVGADNTSPAVVAFRAAFMEKYPGHEPDAFTALGYDTVKLVAAAIEKAGSTDVEAVRKALSTLQDFPGITGNISFSAGNPIPVKSVALVKADKGSEKLVEEILPTNIPAP
ncbi:ABC transporter substrate-binding protein [Sneathiella marina]|uniref:ABC transporter substrate-binding protein n=1 Tax=Sneathiella marina TaxID=2950108 RepID=A0ABY4W2B9_9PROT|nr:ABC transporter substrate-binding protein [Sneathiella marina]USG59464.1 ABC transporter substrate-binding protein [Sneathiella marina]